MSWIWTTDWSGGFPSWTPGCTAAMMSGITQTQWKHMKISRPCFLIIVGMPFTFSVTTGLALGVIAYLVILVCRKRAAMVDPAFCWLGGLIRSDAPAGRCGVIPRFIFPLRARSSK